MVRLRMFATTQLLDPIHRLGVAAHMVEPEGPVTRRHHTVIVGVLALLLVVVSADIG
jgi:hypothetical protein